MNKKDLSSLADNLGYRFTNPSWLREAVQHSSYVNEQRDAEARDNERLEFLGDAVLDLVITHMLMDRFPEGREGDLSRMRATIVNESQLAEVAHRLNLGEHILLGKGEALSRGEEKNSILADALEAVIAAIYLDGGFSAARLFVENQVTSAISSGAVATIDENYKSKLLEYAQSHGFGVPRYLIIKQDGPDHDRTFTVEVHLRNEKYGMGTGKNKKEAEQAAAGEALENIH